MTTVVNLYKSEYDIYIGRAGYGHDGYFGNPIRFNQMCVVCGKTHKDTEQGRRDLIACYKTWFRGKVNSDPEFRERVKALKGKRLGCFCAPKPCHGDVIKAWLDAGCPLRES